MGVLVKKQKGIILTGIVKLSTISFIASLSSSLIDTIWAIYLNSFVNSIAIVGFISASLAIVAFLSYFFIIPIIEKYNKIKVYITTLLLFATTYILFAINTKFYIFIILAFVITILYSLRITSFGILIKDESSKKQLSRNEGIMYTFMDVAWLIGPLISGFISEEYGIGKVFILSAIFLIIAILLFKILKIKNHKNIKKKIDHKFTKNFKDFFKNKDRGLAYILGGGVNFWWSLIYLFIPILILKNNLHIYWVGYFLFAIPIPLLIFQYPFSKLAGKIGFKTIFKIGFIIPCIFALICFFMGNIYVIMILLILASIGLAMLAPTTEAYFFDILKGKEDLRFYGPYNTTIDLNHFISRFSAAIILVFLPFKFLFLFFSLAMFIFFLISFKTRNIIEEKRNDKQNKI